MNLYAEDMSQFTRTDQKSWPFLKLKSMAHLFQVIVQILQVEFNTKNHLTKYWSVLFHLSIFPGTEQINGRNRETPKAFLQPG